MTWDRIGYLQWVRRYTGTAKNDLVNSGIQGIGKDDVGLTGGHVILETCEAPNIQELLGERYDVPAEAICPTIGSTMANFALFEAILERGDEVILEVPNYEPLYAALQRKRFPIRRFRLLEFPHAVQRVGQERQTLGNVRMLAAVQLPLDGKRLAVEPRCIVEQTEVVVDPS